MELAARFCRGWRVLRVHKKPFFVLLMLSFRRNPRIVVHNRSAIRYHPREEEDVFNCRREMVSRGSSRVTQGRFPISCISKVHLDTLNAVSLTLVMRWNGGAAFPRQISDVLTQSGTRLGACWAPIVPAAASF